jgi:hypothetical protein
MSGKSKLPVEYVKRSPRRPGSEKRMIVVPGEGVMSMREYENQLINSGEIKNLPGKIVRVLNSKGGRVRDNQPPKTKKYFRSTKSGAGMTKAGVARYRRENPGSKLKTAVTGKVKPGSKAAKRRKSFCARSLGQMKKFPKAAKDPNSRLRQARRRWKC